MKDYEELLDEALDEAPDEIGGGERFEIPDVQVRKDGKRTVLENLDELAETLDRSQRRISSYLQEELGTAGIAEDGELVLKGKFRKHEIEEKIEEYVDERVICPECGAPDTSIKMEKEVEYLKCHACGARSPL